MARSTALRMALPVMLTIGEALTGGTAPRNAVAFTGFVFPLAVAYAVLRGDLSARPGELVAPLPGRGDRAVLAQRRAASPRSSRRAASR